MKFFHHAKGFLERMRSQLSHEIFYRYYHHFKGLTIDGPPIYIIGCGHSGTSLLLSILDAHSRLYSVPGESYLAFKSKEEQLALLEEFERSTIAAGKRRWVEKTPKHVRKVDELLRLTPDAYFLVMLRDGRDVACSIRDRTGDFEQGVERWIRDNREAEKYLSNPRFHRIKYEDLVSNFEEELTDALEFCDEEFQQELWRYHEEKKYFFSESVRRPDSVKDGEGHDQYRNWQINQPIFDGSGRWVDEMSRSEKNVFKKKAENLLDKYGYSENSDW